MKYSFILKKKLTILIIVTIKILEIHGCSTRKLTIIKVYKTKPITAIFISMSPLLLHPSFCLPPTFKERNILLIFGKIYPNLFLL
jgi:hypothetical protein